MKYLRLLITLVFVIAVVVFASQNTAVVTVSFFSWSAQGALALFLVVAAVAGFLLGILFLMPSLVKGSFLHRRTQNRLKTFERSGDSGTVGQIGTAPSAAEEPAADRTAPPDGPQPT